MTPTLKMNTQPLGDGTPGDKNYFDLEDEEKDKEEITESSHTTNQLDTISALLTILYQKSSNFQEWE